MSVDPFEEPPFVTQSLTTEQIKEVADKCGVTVQSIIDIVAYMNKNDFINLGLVDMNPEVVIGFCLCEQQQAGQL